jgi:hypothetical protein
MTSPSGVAGVFDLRRRALELLHEVEHRDGGLRCSQDVRHTVGRRP